MKVYADHAATTPMRTVAKEAMMEALEDFGNPSSIHAMGRLAAVRLESARKQVAELLNCRQSEVYFTSGGTEADNWAIHTTAIFGSAPVVTSAFEHHAIIRAAEASPCGAIMIKPGADGIIDPHDVKMNIRPGTSLVSIMAANNEIGTIQPLQDIAEMVRRQDGVVLHTDAVQAVGHIPVDVQRMGVDMLSMSAHKFGGPRGAGVLYCRTGIQLGGLLRGGGQERGRRPGTENVPAIVGMAAAMREACERMPEESQKAKNLRDRLINGIRTIQGAHIHGSLEHRLHGNVNCSFDGVEGEAVVIMLDLADICVSSGSACTSGSGEPSHVLTAIGLDRRTAYGAIRITLSADNTEADVDYITTQLVDIVGKLRG